MAARIWKKVLFFVLIVACLFNIITKLYGKYTQEVKQTIEEVMAMRVAVEEP